MNKPPASCQHSPFLKELLDQGILEADDLAAFLDEHGDHLEHEEGRLVEELVLAGLLTPYQGKQIRAGAAGELVLSNYRILDVLGQGGMGTVYLAEHRLMKRRVAVKVLPVDDHCHPAVKQRFYAEMRLLAELSHPNVVTALDAGEIVSPDPDKPNRIYLVMERVEGGDLEQYVCENGTCGVAEACRFIFQAANGLQAAHDRHLVHRDIKPSNLLLASPSGSQTDPDESGMLRVKLVDFGLVREFSSELTVPGTLLGSIDFMAPEQSLNPSAVGKESDIYGLGATLFWLLTGEGPYPFIQHVGRALRHLQHNPPRRLRELLPSVPEPLDELVAQMLHRDPACRPSSPRAVMQALAPFFQHSSRIVPVVGRQEGTEEPECARRDAGPTGAGPTGDGPSGDGMGGARILCVDDDAVVLDLYRHCLLPHGHDCEMAEDGTTCLARAADKTFDLVLLDLYLPDMHGYEVCRQLRRRSGNPSMQVLVVSSAGNPDDLAECLTEGADDYMCKPFGPQQLLAKVDQALKRKRTLEKARQESESLRAEQTVLRRDLVRWTAEARYAQDMLMRVLTQLSQSREGETARHQRRLQQYALTLAREAGQTLSDVPAWSGLVDDRFLEHLERCTPLHDLGKVGLPDDVLLKPGTLEPSERALIQTHVLIGDHLLSALSEQEGVLAGYLQMAQQIVRHHHERFDGRGYPDRLAGNAIPPAARLVSIADVYDALRRLRPHKPAMSHQEAIRVLVNRSPGQFDPWLMRALLACEGEFERIFSAFRD